MTIRIIALAVAALLGGGASAQILAPGTVDAGAAMTIRLERPAPASAGLVLRRFSETGSGAPVARRPLATGAESVAMTAPAHAGSYVLELEIDGRPRHRAPLEVAAPAAMLELNGRPLAGEPLVLAWRGGAARGDRVELVDEAGHVLEAVALDAADGDAPAAGRVRVTAPSHSGRYVARLVAGGGGPVLARVGFEVDAARGAWLRAPAVVAPGRSVGIEWFGPAGPDFAIRLTDPDGARLLVERRLDLPDASVRRVELTAPDRPGRYRLHYLDLATGEPLSTSVLIVR